MTTIGERAMRRSAADARGTASNAHGSLEIAFGANEVLAGGRITGRVRLRVRQRFTCQALTIRLEGRESLHWEEERVGHATPDKLHEECPFLRTQRSCLPTGGRVLEVGEYAYAFDFSLEPTNPGTCKITERTIGRLRNIHASVEYLVTAAVTVKDPQQLPLTPTASSMAAAGGDFLSAKQSVVVHGLPMTTIRTTRKLRDEESHPVRFLKFFRKGTCEIAGTLEKSLVATQDDRIVIHARVENRSPRAMTSLRLGLRCELTIHMPERHRQRHHQHQQLFELGSTRYDGVRPRQVRELDLELPMRVAQAAAVATGRTLLPTMVSNYIAVSYSVVVECSFWMSKPRTLIFPVELLLPAAAAAQRMTEQATAVTKGTTALEDVDLSMPSPRTPSKAKDQHVKA